MAKITTQEYEALLHHAEQIINSLLDIVEKECPTTYSNSEEVLRADDWLKWFGGEMTDLEIYKHFNFIEIKNCWAQVDEDYCEEEAEDGKEYCAKHEAEFNS